MKVEVVAFHAVSVAVLEHCGAVEGLNDSIAQFIEWRKSSGLSPVQSSQTYGVAFDDPETTEAEAFRFDLCGSVKREVPTNPQGVINKVMPAGRCALLRHLGSHDEIGDNVRYLYGTWLPDSGEELRDFPCFFHYLNFFPEVAESELITDIYLPLK